jgi:hypothetical protein
MFAARIAFVAGHNKEKRPLLADNQFYDTMLVVISRLVPCFLVEDFPWSIVVCFSSVQLLSP